MGITEILIILVVIVLLFGSRKLPELMKGMGQGLREFRNEVKDDSADANKTVTQTEVQAVPAGTTVISTKEPAPDTAPTERR